MGMALITGASEGIGKELAHLFAAAGHDVILVARNRAKLEALAQTLITRHGIQANIIVKDLGHPQAADEIYHICQTEQWPIDYLVNNAGFGLLGSFVDTELATETDMIAVNVTALTQLTKRFLPHMVERRSGRILQVASLASFMPGPLMSVYYATKAYVLSFSEALQQELRGTGVTVTALCPGPTNTAFKHRANMNNPPHVEKSSLDVRHVAQAGYAGMMKGKTIVIPGFPYRTFVFLCRFLPRAWVSRFVHFNQKQRL
ncbi:SDR family NAD(P)-dependent oxidoreductase [Laceyella putida]|uniref:SDR family NAD(P)-dependent oxidoreductase n=1 Tax=Laceyella putida TaxID=110101 RepID=A0ABW2RPD8_9BACL